mmetsp:Transcript_21288/g.38866  ORF Transcript_21288/g.38866 Transcript_21288/m.38866 type:complete len:281 (+) Transcript_21288:59-901(+)
MASGPTDPMAREAMELERGLMSSNVLSKDVAIDIRMNFVRKVYTLLTCQLLLTAAVAIPIAAIGPVLAHDRLFRITCLVIYAATLGLLSCCEVQLRTYPNNYILLGIFGVATGLLTGMSISWVPLHIVVVALAMTIFIFLVLTLYACTTRADFTGFSPYLVLFTMVLIAFGMAIAFEASVGLPIHLARHLYCAGGTLAFVGFTVVDTQLMIGEWGGRGRQFKVDDYCYAVLSLYLDIMGLFRFILHWVRTSEAFQENGCNSNDWECGSCGSCGDMDGGGD